MGLIIYKNAEGERVPGTTTIIGSNLGWSAKALQYWAWNEGIEGRNYRDTLSRAADIGTVSHAMIEADLKGRDFDSSKYDKDMIDKAETSYLAWLEWKETVSFKLLESEKSLVSEEHQFGGTIDIVNVKKVFSVLDLKTSKAVYPDHLIQISAYGRLLEEHYKEKVQGYYILRIDKETAGFSYHYWPNLDKAWEAFKALLILHRLKKEI